jgi:hypothetical protein
VSSILQAVGLLCLVVAGWAFNTILGIALLGGFLILVGYALDGVPVRFGRSKAEDAS